MIRFSYPVQFAAIALVCSATLLRAVDPYQTRQDREYKSLSNAISRAYSPPPPRPSTPTRSYSPPSASKPSYSSSSMGRSWSPPPSNNSSSYSKPTESYRQTAARFEQERADAQKSFAAIRQENAARQRAAEAAAAARRQANAEAAAARAAREKFLASPSHTPTEWSALVARTKGKAPLAAPINGVFESRRSEFAYFLKISQQPGIRAEWENMRLGQMCLLLQGEGANPNRAFEFFSKSNEQWPEVQLGLGQCYLRGYGVAPDPVKGRELLEKAAAYIAKDDGAQNYVSPGNSYLDLVYTAARELAVAYDLGRGLAADENLALQWYDFAQQRPLYQNDLEELQALRREFWQRHARRMRPLLEQRFARMKEGERTVMDVGLLTELTRVGDAQALYEVGDLIDTRSAQAKGIGAGSSGRRYYLAAAKLNHDGAARAYFSPTKNGAYSRDLEGDSVTAEQMKLVAAQWPQWEKRWQDAAKAGDASAHIPLAFYYSGAGGNPPDEARAKQHAALMPATMPAPQRATVEGWIRLASVREGEAWARTVWAALGTTYNQVDLTRLTVKADPARGAALRDEGIVLADTQIALARDRWRDAAALGDLPAQVQLYFYAKRYDIGLGEYPRSLQVKVEAAARGGDLGAIAALAVLMDGSVNNRLSLPTATYDVGRGWRAKALEGSPQKARFLEIGTNPALSDAQCVAVREAALRETATWHEQARKWGLAGQYVITELTLSDAEIRRVDAMRQQFVALAAAARQLTQQLAVWEKTVEAGEFDPEADARFIQGYVAWQGRDESERDVALAIDYFSQSAGLGHPLAPLALAYFFGCGYGGFPQDAAVSQRYRRLAEQRLGAMAEDGDLWAQTMLGDLLVRDHDEREDLVNNPFTYEWLPQDKPRGLKWLKAAAVEGAVLPRNFGDSSGQTVAWYVAQRYSDEQDALAYAKWNLIDEALRRAYGDDEAAAASARAKAMTAVRGIVAESVEAERARVALDQAIETAATDELRSAAHRRRALVRQAAKLDALALEDAERAAAFAMADPAVWKSLADFQRAEAQDLEAAVSVSLAQALENQPGAVARFEAALAKIDPDKRELLKDQLTSAAEENPKSTVFKALAASAVKVAAGK